MTHNELLNIYKTMFNAVNVPYCNRFANMEIDVWFSNGKDSIRVRYTDKTELVFTYHDKNNWKLETLNEFIKSIKGGTK